MILSGRNAHRPTISTNLSDGQNILVREITKINNKASPSKLVIDSEEGGREALEDAVEDAIEVSCMPPQRTFVKQTFEQKRKCGRAGKMSSAKFRLRAANSTLPDSKAHSTDFIYSSALSTPFRREVSDGRTTPVDKGRRLPIDN